MPIPPKIRARIAKDPFFKKCARTDDLEHCDGRITIDHALYYAGKRISAFFALVPVCEYHHLGDGLVKAKNADIAMRRATAADRAKYPNLPWRRYPHP